MEKNTHKPIMLKINAYEQAQRMAHLEGRSMSEIVSEAIEERVSSRRQLYRQFEEFVKYVKKKETPNASSTSDSPE